jgi:thiol-disulfide isomerase/thioredoxin
MKQFSKYLTAALILGTTIYSCNQQPSYTIDGKINVDSGKIYLQNFRNKTFFILDSSKITNGTFNFKGSVQRTDLYGLTTDRGESFHPYYIFLENKPITVLIDTTDHRSAKISGSASNDLFIEYQSSRKDFKIDSFIGAHPSSIVAAYILYREFSYRLTADQIEKSISLFDSTLQNVEYIKELKTLITIKKRVEIGNPAIDFSALTPEGKEIKLSQSFGNYLLVDFWASWCGPCRKENPNIIKAYKKYHPQGFTIFAVSLDKKKEDWLKAIKSDGLDWTQVSDLKFWGSEPAKLYGIRSIPSNVLIDPSGKIIGRNLRGEELDKKLEELYVKK